MCGVVGIYDHPEAANLAYLGLHALQHRGQESAGVVTNDRGTLSAVRRMGHVADVFNNERIARLKGPIAVGNVRYTTAGGSLPKNIQPLTAELSAGAIAIAHNGNLVNADALRLELESKGSIIHSNSDTEVILQLMARSGERRPEDQLADALSKVRGAYSVVVTAGDRIIAARDPHGFRPLILGRFPNRPTSWVVASETCAFDLIEAERVRDVEAGEIVVIDGDGMRSHHLPTDEPRRCIFEYVYFARPDSVLDDRSVYEARIAMGRELARQHPIEADVVVPVPDSGVVAAMGFAREANVPFAMGLIRNHYVGRTFIEPKDSIRHFGVKLKLNAVPEILKDRRVVVVDDSIVRGTTSRKIVKMIREAGAREIHVRISSPPVSSPCFYGIDTPTRAELIASSHSVDEVRRYITADSLSYLDPKALLRSVGDPDNQRHCTACFTGEYAVPFEAPPGRRQLRLIEV